MGSTSKQPTGILSLRSGRVLAFGLPLLPLAPRSHCSARRKETLFTASKQDASSLLQAPMAPTEQRLVTLQSTPRDDRPGGPYATDTTLPIELPSPVANHSRTAPEAEHMQCDCINGASASINAHDAPLRNHPPLSHPLIALPATPVEGRWENLPTVCIRTQSLMILRDSLAQLLPSPSHPGLLVLPIPNSGPCSLLPSLPAVGQC